MFEAEGLFQDAVQVVYISFQVPVMMQLHGLFIYVRFQSIIRIRQRRIFKWIMFVQGNSSFIYIIYKERMSSHTLRFICLFFEADTLSLCAFLPHDFWI